MKRRRRTLHHIAMIQYRNAGYLVDTTERRVSKNVTKDLFELFDFIAIDEDGLVGVQVTDFSNFSKRRNKILESEVTPVWLKSSLIDVVGVRTAGDDTVSMKIESVRIGSGSEPVTWNHRTVQPEELR